MEKNIRSLLIELIKQSLVELALDKASAEDISLDFPTDARFGDMSTNIALKLSKPLKKSPLEISRAIAAQIKEGIKNNPLKDYISEVKAEGAGFINFYLSQGYFYEYLRELVSGGTKAIRDDVGKAKRVMVEFVSANPTGPLSVAHARQAAVGDALANILDFLGFQVQREYYLNDKGNQINILGRSIELRLKESRGEQIEFPEDHYQGDYIRSIAEEINEKNLKIADFSEFGVEYILKIIRKELDDFGVKFDCWFSQKALEESGKIEKALDTLKENGFVYEQEGALWFKSTGLGDDKDRVVIKSDGSYTYLAPDIAYHQDKYRRGFEQLINLWGPDHHGYINRLKASVKAFGKDADSLSIVIVQLASIFREGKPLQMSTRKGQYITLREVLDEVGRDAARFFFLMRRTSSHLDFDLEIAKKQTSENPVYYVQYAYARICSILNSSPEEIILRDLDLTVLKEKEEIELIKKLWRFSAALNICLVTLDPYMLTVYLQELSEDFHKFYDLHRVLGQEPRITQARLILLQATKAVIACGLQLLSVSRPEKM